MNKKNNSITLFLPSMFEDIPITIVRGIHNRQVLIDIQSKNVEVNRKGILQPVFVYTNGSYTRIMHDKILYVEADGSYCKIVYDGLKTLILSFPLSEACKILPENFIRVHRSFVVNLDYVTQVSGNRLYVKDTWINVGREYREETFTHFIFFHAKRHKNGY